MKSPMRRWLPAIVSWLQVNRVQYVWNSPDEGSPVFRGGGMPVVHRESPSNDQPSDEMRRLLAEAQVPIRCYVDPRDIYLA